MRSVKTAVGDFDVVPLWLYPAAGGQQSHRLTRGDDTYYVSDAGEYVLGLGGDDFIAGGDGADHLKGGNGNDSVGGSRGADIVEGGSGNDSLGGGAGDDRVFGDDGNDQLSGEGGRDVFVGGLGADSIQVNNFASKGSDGNRDTVLYNSIDETDGDECYLFGCGEDRFDLSALDANVLTPEDDRFHYIGDRAFSGTPGELRAGSNGFAGDIDGDGAADFFVELQFTQGTFTRHDFVL